MSRPGARPSIAACVTIVALLVPGGAGLPLADESARPAASPAIEVTLSMADGAVYAKGPFRVKVTFRNPGEQRTLIPAEAFSPAAFALTDPGGKRAPSIALPAEGAPATPLDLDGYLTTSRIIDIAGWYKGSTSKKAIWDLSWQHGGLKAGPLRVKVIRPHDPAKDRFAVVTTAMGAMTWELLPQDAPEHVKRFVDLARQGFYDGLTLYRIIPGVQAEGGDPKGDGTGGWDSLMPGEMSPRVKPAVGLVGAQRQETSMTSDSLFFITLAPNEFMIGKQSFFARTTKGIDVVARLNLVPVEPERGLKGAYLAREPVRIHSIEIR